MKFSNTVLNIFLSLSFFLFYTGFFCVHADTDERPRVIVSTDIGGSDPDDFQSMVHYLVYADQFITEGLVSSPPFGGRAEHIMECILAYEEDYDNLRTWSSDYPTPDTLRAVVRQGAIDPQAEEVPGSAISEGAKLIIEKALKKDPKPLYILVWGSITDVAQAICKEPAIKKKVRMYSIGSWNTQMDQNARNYLYNNHPDLWWIECNTTFRGMYMGGDQSGDMGNVTFPENHIKDYGALGNLFMDKKADIKMGDTPSVLYLLQGNPLLPETPHWGGAFVLPEPQGRPAFWTDNPNPDLRERDKDGAKTVNTWRKDYLSDWAVRMEHCAAANDKLDIASCIQARAMRFFGRKN